MVRLANFGDCAPNPGPPHSGIAPVSVPHIVHIRAFVR